MEINGLDAVLFRAPTALGARDPCGVDVGRAKSEIRGQNGDLVPQPDQKAGNGSNLDCGPAALLKGIVSPALPSGSARDSSSSASFYEKGSQHLEVDR